VISCSASEPQTRRRPAANYCGIDLAGVSSYAYVTDEKGRKLWAGALGTERAAFERLVKKFRRGGLPIAIEGGNQTAWASWGVGEGAAHAR
jgi:hypothetical protein